MQYQPTWQNPYLPLANQGQPVLPVPQYQQPVNGITKVNGRDSAMQYQLPPNSTSPALFDKDGTCFYVVSTDGTGTKTVETFDFSTHQDPQPMDPGQYVSRSEFDKLVSKVDSMIGAVNGTNAAVQPAATQQPIPQPANNAQADARQ
jgi:hypothetical protein